MAKYVYRLVVEGELSDHLGRAFEGMTLTRGEGNSSLEGSVDQAQLHGFLQRISALGLTLVSATQLDAQGEPAAGGEGPASA